MIHFYFEFTYMGSTIFGEIEAENIDIAREELLVRYNGFFISDKESIHVWPFSHPFCPKRDLFFIKNVYPCDIGSIETHGVFLGPPKRSRKHSKSDLMDQGVHGVYVPIDVYKSMCLEKRLENRRLYLLSKKGIDV